MKILITDDSLVFRSQIRKAIETEPGLEVVGVAANGKICLDKLKIMDIDLITLDVEMPVLGGLDTIKEMRRLGYKTKVILFSSLTQKGSETTIQALSLGADDFVAKPTSMAGGDVAATIAKQLLPKINQFRKDGPVSKPIAAKLATSHVDVEEYHPERLLHRPKIVVIASSTGGPLALEKVFSEIKSPIRCPICIAQHMPPIFTKSLASRLQNQTGVVACEAEKMTLLENKIYVAPGDFHMSLKEVNEKVYLNLDQSAHRNSVRPCANFLFESAAELFGAGCFGIVLTGMGQDGADGSIAVRSHGGKILVQDEESCAVFGMPMSVLEVKAADYMGNLEQIAKGLAMMVN